MKARWRILVAASAVLLTAGTPALAQETAAPAQKEVIGPPQLQNFSLNGTVTREAPAPVQPQPAPRQTRSAATAETPTAASPPPSRPARESAAATARQQPERSASTSAADLPPPTPAPRVPPRPVSAAADSAALSPQPGFISETADSTLEPSGNQLPLFPWLVAALALAGAVAWYLLRQRPRESLAGAGGLDLFEAPSPAQPPVRPAPAPAPKQPTSGIVSTRLRPWLEIEFTPLRAVVDEEKAAIAFQLTVLNSGSIPARDVLLEGSLFNAGPMQDQQIRAFFENPLAEGDRISMIGPLKKVSVNTAVYLPRDQVRPIEVEGRPLFVPMVALNALYRWSSGEAQSSVSYLVGKTTKTDKLAPFRLDLGPRVFRSLAAREHELRLRK